MSDPPTTITETENEEIEIETETTTTTTTTEPFIPQWKKTDNWEDMFDFIEGDIFSDFGRGEEFLIDGDSLLLYLVAIENEIEKDHLKGLIGRKRNNTERDESIFAAKHSQQTLHLIFKFEKFLNSLLQRKAKFSIIFLSKNDRFYKSSSLVLVRRLIINSYKDNISLPFGFKVFDQEWFSQEIGSFNPLFDYFKSKTFSFLLVLPPVVNNLRLINDLFNMNAIQLFTKKSTEYFSHFVDLISSEFRGSTMNSYIYTFRKNIIFSPQLQSTIQQEICQVNSVTSSVGNQKKSTITELEKELDTIGQLNYRNLLTLLSILDLGKVDISSFLLKSLSVYLVIMNNLPLSKRSFDSLDYEPIEFIQLFQDLCRPMLCYLGNNKKDQFTFDLVDVKQYSFIALILCNSTGGSWSNLIGQELFLASKSILEILKKFGPSSWSSINFVEQGVEEKFIFSTQPEYNQYEKVLTKIQTNSHLNDNKNMDLYKVDNEFISAIVGDSQKDLVFQSTIPQEIQDRQNALPEFYNISHHHSLRLLENLPDAYLETIKENRQANKPISKKFADKMKHGAANKFFRIADSLYDSKKKIVITELDKDVKEVAKQKQSHQVNKQHDKMKKLKKKDEVKERADKKQQEKAKAFSKQMRASTVLEIVDSIDLYIANEIVEHNEFSLDKDTMDQLFKGMERINKKYSSQEKEKLKLYQLLQKILRLLDSKQIKPEKGQEINLYQSLYHLSLLLNLYDLTNYINDRFSLKNKEKKEKQQSFENSAIVYQMTHSHTTLVRSIGQRKDERVKTFIPDAWQRDLLDVVDKHESALVVCPTSSGKTFISFYILEKVLRESNDGMAIYVSPTKALVTQTYCEVIGRFDKSYDNICGKDSSAQYRMCGIFTRDYRIDEQKCQILITVPQCLELLLLSVSNSNYLSKIKYIIFDEVHQIANGTEGAIWESLLLLNPGPFVALSATVGNTGEFKDWLQEIDPKRKIHLVQHSNRFNDLKHYQYDHDNLQLLPHHPCETLRINKSTEQLFLLSEEAIQLYQHIKSSFKQLDNEIGELDPIKVFTRVSNNNNVYNLNKQDIKDYQRALLDLVESRLKSDEFSAFMSEHYPEKHLRHDDWRSRVPEVIMDLKKRDMLPVIVFCLSRRICEKLALALEEHIDKMHYDPKKQQKIDLLEKKIEQVKLEIKTVNPTQDDDIFQDLEKLTSTLSLLVSRKPEFGTILTDDVHDPKGKIKKLDLFGPLMEGIGVHHAGLPKDYLENVEVLYRRKKISVIFATGTLALGINMPCRTVVVAGDSPYLNSLSFRQMAGRAGRRGFEDRGNVIFLGISDTRAQKLINSNLSDIVGNSVLTPSLCLKILCRYNFFQLEKQTDLNEKHVQELIFATQKVVGKSFFMKRSPFQNPFMFLFSLDYLFRQGYLSQNGQALGYASIATHLSYLQPFNFVVCRLFRDQVFGDFLGKSKYDEREILHILCYLFNRKEIPNIIDIDKCPSKITLPKLPNNVITSINKNNQEVIDTFVAYVAGLQKKLPLVYMPISKSMDEQFTKEEENTIDQSNSHTTWFNTIDNYIEKKPQLKKSITSLAGSCNNIVDTTTLQHSMPPGTFFDQSVLPICNINTKQANSYLLDLYKHKQVNTVIECNHIPKGEIFELTKDFALTLKVLSTSLLRIDKDSNVAKSFETLANNYSRLFNQLFLN
ncbi:hypothetical protein DFA_08780 [Cavenderia fasciculata]|uniref:DEAD/DEAH box helicase n=1 Tax=Cavenderia fasciculata TaxID=261658 RepID=F4Q478_CACFS|nr:uncharacterized protein DFA_08780 [Cavenderia fasciculata]EGG17780.1 hypothetical protein DFA_08780 [Cavenderia fasciculata]|eukprot:XP_004356264.1 hypothetical protein DFA_08780 [Cavenderia fasciculata]